MNIIKNKKFENGCFKTTKCTGWAVFDLRKNGIICTMQDFPVEGKFCSKISVWGDVYIPTQIECQYNLHGNLKIKEIANNAFVIEARCSGIIPRFPENVSYRNTAVEGNIKFETVMPLQGARLLNINRKDQKLIDLNAVIKVHAGDYNAIEVIPNSSCGYSLQNLRDLYGANMNRCFGNYLEYDNPNSSEYQLGIPAFWANQCGVEKNDDVRVVVLDDGRVLITPIPKEDEITGNPILPESEKEENVTLCGECNESDALKLLITELQKMQELVTSQAKTNELLKLELETCIEENQSLRNDVNQLRKMIRNFF